MDPLLILFVLSLNIAFCEFLVRRTAARHLGTALLVILVTAITANLGLVPTYSGEVAIYAAIFDVVAPLGIFLLLLNVGLRQVLRAGSSMLTLFLIGAIGTVAGVVTGMAVIGGSEALGPKAPALGGMFVGTYVGGSINFNAIALEFKVREFPLLYAGANAVDALMTVVWMAATIALPRLLARFWPPSTRSVEIAATAEETNHHEAERVDPLQLTLLLAMGLGCVKASNWLAEQSKAWFASPEDQTEVHGIPAILILTTIALCLAQWPRIRAIAGSRLLGLLAVYYFLAVIGALCDIAAMGELGGLLWTLLTFVTVTILVHGTIVFGSARALKIDPQVAAVASQANIGGGTSALALARSLNRSDLILPAILVGSLGSALGTYLGFLTVGILT